MRARRDNVGRRTTAKETRLLDRRVDVACARTRLVEVWLRGRSEDALCGKMTDVGRALSQRFMLLRVSAGRVQASDEPVDVRLVAVVVVIRGESVPTVSIKNACADGRQLLEGVGPRTVQTATTDVVAPAVLADHNLEGVARLAAVDGGGSAATLAFRRRRDGVCRKSCGLGKRSGIAGTDCDLLGNIVVRMTFGAVLVVGRRIISKERTDAGIANRSDSRAAGRSRLFEKIKRRLAPGLLPRRGRRNRAVLDHFVDGRVAGNKCGHVVLFVACVFECRVS